MFDILPREYLAIDPSLVSMGWAYFKKGKLMKSGTKRFKTKNVSWLRRLDQCVDVVNKLVCAGHPKVMLIEMPAHMGNQASNTQSILKLMGLVCALRERFKNLLIVHLIPVRLWKGTAPKRVTQDRVRKRYGQCWKSHDEADAIGIGDWFLNGANRVRLSRVFESVP